MKLMPEIDLRIVFEDHYASLVRFCLLVTGNHDAAEDLAQEAFVRVIGRSQGQPIEDVGAYLRKIALNLWRNRLRRLLLERPQAASQRPNPLKRRITRRATMWCGVRYNNCLIVNVPVWFCATTKTCQFVRPPPSSEPPKDRSRATQAKPSHD